MTDNLPISSIKVFRGTEKTANKPGQDLGEKFRVEIPNSLVMEFLMNAYPDAEIVGEDSLVVKRLNVYFYSNNIEETLFQNYVCFQGNNFRFSCDRDRLLSTNKEGKTRECSSKGKPPEEKCPQGCARNARLQFYIKELVDDYGDYSLASMTITSVYEWYRLPDRLSEIQKIVGGIKDTDLPSPNGMIPFYLSREKVQINRNFNGKKSRSDFYMVKIAIDPEWYQQIRMYQNFMSLPPEIRRKAIESGSLKLEGVVGLKLLQASYTETPQLPSSTEDVKMLPANLPD